MLERFRKVVGAFLEFKWGCDGEGCLSSGVTDVGLSGAFIED